MEEKPLHPSMEKVMNLSKFFKNMVFVRSGSIEVGSMEVGGFSRVRVVYFLSQDKRTRIRVTDLHDGLLVEVRSWYLPWLFASRIEEHTLSDEERVTLKQRFFLSYKEDADLKDLLEEKRVQRVRDKLVGS